jgi:hypothetical protein
MGLREGQDQAIFNRSLVCSPISITRTNVVESYDQAASSLASLPDEVFGTDTAND